MGTEMKEEKKGKVGILKFWTWNFRTMSAGIQAVLIGYIVFYCTDVLELNAALVATLLMASKIFDGVTDILAGYLVDKTHTRLGKARPYEFAIIGLWVATWAVFSVPTSLSTVAKCVWVVVAYTMAQSVFNTLLNANNTAYMVRAFNSQQTYVKLSSIGGLVTVAGVAVFNVVFPTMMANAGTDAGKWSHMILMLAAPLAIIGILRFFFVPEKYDVDAGSASVNFKEVITLLKTNKYIYFVALVTLVAQIIYTIVNQGIRPLGMSAGDFDLAVADSWHGPYRVLGNPHPEDASHTSFHSQISCIFKVEGTKDLYIAAADRWCPDCMDLDYEFYAKVYDKLFSGTEEEKSRIRQMPEFSRIDDMGRNTSIADYVWLPIRFVEACEEYPQGMVFIDWKDEWCWQDYVGR